MKSNIIFVGIILVCLVVLSISYISEGYTSIDNDLLYSFIKNIPNINKNPLQYVFEDMNYKHKENTLWLEFGVFEGYTINYFSKYTVDNVYGFDSFEGLPEKWRDGFDKGAFNIDGVLPQVNNNVKLIKGWFNETLDTFIQEHNKKISFIHIDCDIYSSTKYIFDTLAKYIDNGCIIVFDELLNYDGFEEGELLAFYEFVQKNNVKFEWIGLNGLPRDGGEQVGVIINSIN